MNSGINVLSLFDGCSCGREALERAGVEVNTYYASEIDKYAITVSKTRYPDIVRLGDVRGVSDFDVPKIDLLIGGSPCQGFSFAGKQLNFDDPRSVLFFEFARLLEELKEANPDIKFLLENVKMKKEYQDVISGILGVQPIEINSALVSAQNRKRLYWTNIEGVQQPEDKGIFLKDIVHEFSLVDRDKATVLTAGYQQTSPADYFEKSRGQYVLSYLSEKELAYMSREGADGRDHFSRHGSDTAEPKSGTVTASFAKGVPYNVLAVSGQLSDKEMAYMNRTPSNNHSGGKTRLERYSNSLDGKSFCLTASWAKGVPYNVVGITGKGRGKRKEGLVSDQNKTPALTANSWETNNFLTFKPIDSNVKVSEGHSSKNGLVYFGGINTGSDWGKDGKNLQRNFSQGNRIYRTEGKSPALSASMGGGAAGGALVVEEIEDVLYYRKLTPIECERLQTLPDDYTAGVSNSQRYRMLGNGWTVDVIAHILSYYW